MITIDKKSCTGCSACVNICPKNCITMNKDKEGFEYPLVNQDLCIDCHLCENACRLGKEIKKDTTPTPIACYNTDEGIRLKSSSGGIFYLLARLVLEQEGIVFGAAFDDDFHVHHISIDSIDQLPMLMKSKYMQSSIGNTFKEAKKYLDEGRLVYFTGTPCQIKGLHYYLKKDYSNLITQDIVCHGVPSNQAFDKYVSDINKDILLNVDFRSKDTSWKRYHMVLEFKNNKHSKMKNDDSYIIAFATLNANLRYSCYQCQANGVNREADITLGDFWGIDKIDKDMFDDRGTSLVLIHSLKGEKLFEQIKEYIVYKEESLDETLKYNQSIYLSSKTPKFRDSFYKELENKSFTSLVDKLLFYNKVKNKLSRLGKKIKK